MRHVLVVLPHEGLQALLHLMSRGGGGGQEGQAPLAQGAPEALHLATGRRVVRPGVDERDAEPGAGSAEDLTGVGRAVVEVEDVGRPVLAASSPTGFFNPRMGPVVEEIGYRALCVGRIALWTAPSDRFRIPRLPVKYRTAPADYRRMVLGNRRFVARARGEQMARNGLKSLLGVDRYTRLRQWMLGLPSWRRD